MKTLRNGLMMAAAFVPVPLFACATCGGAHADSPLANGMNAGIFTLMGVIVTVLLGVVLFFVHIVRKEEAQSDPPPRKPNNV